jgi:hypothetical protein
LGTILTNQNLIEDEIKMKRNSAKACYHSVQNLLSSRLLLKSAKMRMHKIIILPVVLFEFQTWSLTSKAEHRFGLFENRVRRRIFGPKRDEVTGMWRKLHNEELHDLYPSPSIITLIKSRRMKWTGQIARMGRIITHMGH